MLATKDSTRPVMKIAHLHSGSDFIKFNILLLLTDAYLQAHGSGPYFFFLIYF